VVGDAVTVWGNLTINGTVEDADAVVAGGFVQLGPRASIGGDVVSVGGSVDMATGAIVGGEVDSVWYVHLAGQPHLFYPGALMHLVFWIATALVIGFVWTLTLGFASARDPRPRLLASLLAGTIAAGALGAAQVLLPDGSGFWEASSTLLASFHVGLFAVGYFLLSALVGRSCSPSRGTAVQLLAGSSILTVATLIPWLGLIAACFFYFLSMGIVTWRLLSILRVPGFSRRG
jgi:hypothetical protein